MEIRRHFDPNMKNRNAAIRRHFDETMKNRKNEVRKHETHKKTEIDFLVKIRISGARVWDISYII